MLTQCYLYSVNAVISPEFEKTEYTVPEDGSPLEICIVIEGQQLERDVVATFQTVDDTALGSYVQLPHFLGHCQIIIKLFITCCHVNRI